MYAWRIAETTDAPTLFANPRHPYTEALPAGDSHFFRCFFPVGAIEVAGPGPAPAVAGDAPAASSATARPADTLPDDTLPADGVSAEPRPEPPDEAAASPGGKGEFLRVDQVVKNFAVTSGAVLQRRIGQVSAVADVSFGLPLGQTFGLVGGSGCGKTTIGRLFVGLEKPTSGRILLDGHDIPRQSRHDRRLRAPAAQLMFQDSYASMDPRMRVGTILREPLAIARDGSRVDQRRRIADTVPVADPAAERLPVPHPLPPRPGTVRHHRAAAAPLHQRRSPGRVPLPAPRAGAGPGAGGRIGRP